MWREAEEEAEEEEEYKDIMQVTAYTPQSTARTTAKPAHISPHATTVWGTRGMPRRWRRGSACRWIPTKTSFGGLESAAKPPF